MEFWTCKLCEQSKNLVGEHEFCRTCKRSKGYKPSYKKGGATSSFSSRDECGFDSYGYDGLSSRADPYGLGGLPPGLVGDTHTLDDRFSSAFDTGFRNPSGTNPLSATYGSGAHGLGKPYKTENRNVGMNRKHSVANYAIDPMNPIGGPVNPLAPGWGSTHRVKPSSGGRTTITTKAAAEGAESEAVEEDGTEGEENNKFNDDCSVYNKNSPSYKYANSLETEYTPAYKDNLMSGVKGYPSSNQFGDGGGFSEEGISSVYGPNFGYSDGSEGDDETEDRWAFYVGIGIIGLMIFLYGKAFWDDYWNGYIGQGRRGVINRYSTEDGRAYDESGFHIGFGSGSDSDLDDETRYYTWKDGKRQELYEDL